MVIVILCFNLHGQCEEAIQLYEQAFGATTQCMLRYADADKKDWDAPLTEQQKHMVYHAEVCIGQQRVMFSDIIEFDLVQGTSLFLAVTFDNAERVKRAFEILREGSTIIYPMRSTTYSSCFVSFVDKFGFRWVLMTEQTDK